MAPPPHHLEPSKLGTKEYWDALYTNELSNHAADPTDTGTVWFDDADAERKTLSFLSNSLPQAASLDPGTASVLDVGCGNGSFLFSLRDYHEGEDEDGDEDDAEADEGDDKKDGGPEDKKRDVWAGRMLGVDYSPQSVALANQILASGENSHSHRVQNIAFREWDILNGPFDAVLDGMQSQGWDIVHDKGTFDAISLSDAIDAQGRRVCEGYRARALGLVRDGGYFVITSCNWTEPELEAWFAPSESAHGGDGMNSNARFILDGRVQYRTFSFGGVKGQPVTTLCFRKVTQE